MMHFQAIMLKLHNSLYPSILTTILIGLLCLTSTTFAQQNLPADFGFRHLKTVYQGDTVDILIKTGKDGELKKKPLLLFIQGSLPIPLIITYKNGTKPGIYNVFVFDTDTLLRDFHLAIIGKPYIPVMADKMVLKNDLTWTNIDGSFSKEYVDRNFLDYYVGRNIEVINFLQTQRWVSTEKLIVAGHDWLPF